MSYATLQALADRYGASMLVGLTDRGPVATGTIDAAVVDRALADTAAMIDGYVAARYALPLTGPQPLLADLAVMIAIWKLHTHAADPKIEADYRESLRMLRDISAGTVKLTAAGAEPATTGGGGARLTDRARPLNADDMKGFI